MIGMLFCLATVNAAAQFATSKAFPDQYKKQNRNALHRLLQGQTDTVVQYFHQYLDSFPGDLESHYGLAAAYSQRGFFYKALKNVKRAVRLGMPLERFVAGPSALLEPLTSRNSFKSYYYKHGKPLVHGPMQTNFTDGSAAFWVRTDQGREVQIVIDGGYAVSVETKAENDFSGVIKIADLQPDRSYMYEVRIDNEVLHMDSFRTFPVAGQKAAFTLGFGGGAGYTPQFERMWDTINTHDLTAFIQMGDNIYHDTPKEVEIQRYCYYRRQSRPEYRRMVSSTPIYAIWDDHDFGDNDCYGGADPNFPVWKQDVWRVFKEQWNNPYYGGGEDDPGCYFDFGIADVDFFMLDCRYYRTNVHDDFKPDSMLGAVQTSWLRDRLLSSTATFKVIATSVPISQGTKGGKAGLDTWDGFAEEREALFSFIEENSINGVFFVAADRHRSDIWKTERATGYPFYEFMSSRLTNIHTHPVPAAAIFGYNDKPSFGLLSFDTQQIDPTVTYKIYSIDNEEIYGHTIYWSELSDQ
ncbi:MAG: alkaline phosphatase family protein [Saprospiraceae bacterium]|nr:alkaline phosphatase family protein [Saprospiraceae bacterium]